MRWIVAAGLAGAILEGLLWFGVLMTIAHVTPGDLLPFALGTVVGAIVVAAIWLSWLAKALKR